MSEHAFKVLCFGDDGILRGLNWAAEHTLLTHSIEFYAADLFTDHAIDINDYHYFLFFVDLAQPLPTEKLKPYSNKPGLCFFIQPTPQQLLQVAELALWRPALWDGSDYNLVLQKLELVLEQYAELNRLEQFKTMTLKWIEQNQSTPGHLELLNPPADWSGSAMIILDRSQILYSIGDINSQCDIRLPFEVRGEIGQLFFQNSKWFFRHRARPQSSILLNNGQRLEIENLNLAVRSHKKVGELAALAESIGIIEAPTLDPKQHSGFEACLEVMLGLRTGALEITSAGKNGSLFVESGIIRGAACGAIEGTKALFRIFSWQNIEYHFEHEVLMPTGCERLMIKISDLLEHHRSWTKKWQKLSHMAPPAQLKLYPQANTFYNKTEWDAKSLSVFHSVCTYQRTLEVLNYTHLMDADVIEELIRLKQSQLIYSTNK